ncbi:MAG TPA: DUF488 domain-containing protein [Xanthobacteraceae bacterium]|nr:DUF488 domain-containing protein [Xanthobacteraceae bacterium]
MTAKKRKPTLFTIGYEKATQSAVLDELKRAKVDILVDVRAVAASRRPGFSKRQLAAGLDEAGIAYLHLQKLGTPAEGREAAHSGHVDAMLRIYERHLKTAAAREEMDALEALVREGKRVCLLCYERDVDMCHRRRLAELLQERQGVKVENLVAPLF